MFSTKTDKRLTSTGLVLKPAKVLHTLTRPRTLFRSRGQAGQEMQGHSKRKLKEKGRADWERIEGEGKTKREREREKSNRKGER